MSDLLMEIREACAWVSAQAIQVRIDGERLEAYAAELRPGGSPAELGAGVTAEPEAEAEAAFWLTLDAINFGSGWFPTVRKRPGLSGYNTIASAWRERYEREGPWSAAELAEIDSGAVAQVLEQDPRHELMALFASVLRDLGEHAVREHGGSFRAAAAGPVVSLVPRLAAWSCFTDASTYRGRRVPFFKRAQIAAADLARAGVIAAPDLARLTMFADNLVPHVLRLDGVLQFAPDLVERIEREELIRHGSCEEVEIRACALHAVELMVQRRPDLTAARVDQLLWLRGGEDRYKARPRHRSRCTAY